MPPVLTLTIREQSLRTSDYYTDRDVISLSSLSDDASGISRRLREEEALEALLAILPQIETEYPDWIKGGRIRLSTYEILPLITALSEALQADPVMSASIAYAQAAKERQERPDPSPINSFADLAPVVVKQAAPAGFGKPQSLKTEQIKKLEEELAALRDR